MRGKRLAKALERKRRELLKGPEATRTRRVIKDIDVPRLKVIKE